MAIVFHAEELTLRRPVALKVIKPNLENNEESWQRFLREARMTAAIRHDHIVTLYQAGQEGEVLWFAMELLEGESLEEWMQFTPRPEVAEIVRIAREIASGLAVIHRQGIVHRDIKPANIWLEGEARRVKILDLGLARPLREDTSLTKSGTIVGTPAFMSPEQAGNEPLDSRSDLFSLGCVLYYLCTGIKPFRGDTIMAVLKSLISDQPRLISDVNPRIAGPLSDLIMQLLAKQPEQRPASAEEVIRQLQQIERGLADRTLRSDPGTGTQLLSSGTLPTMHGQEPSTPRRISRKVIAGLTAAGLALLAVPAA